MSREQKEAILEQLNALYAEDDLSKIKRLLNKIGRDTKTETLALQISEWQSKSTIALKRTLLTITLFVTASAFLFGSRSWYEIGILGLGFQGASYIKAQLVLSFFISLVLGLFLLSITKDQSLRDYLLKESTKELSEGLLYYKKLIKQIDEINRRKDDSDPTLTFADFLCGVFRVNNDPASDASRAINDYERYIYPNILKQRIQDYVDYLLPVCLSVVALIIILSEPFNFKI